VDNLSEEVRKGLREKAAQGHWPTVAPVGYRNNRETHRIEVDPVRGPLVSRVFTLYASGRYSLKAVTQQAYEIGLRHSRGDRRMTKSEIHRMLRMLIYTGDFMWLGKRYEGKHEPLVSHDTYAQVQAVLGGKPRPRRARHAFMGLLTCARCGCAMTAEIKKGRYVYYRCTGARGACGNTYIREEQLADLLGTVVEQIQIPEPVADELAASLSAGQADLERDRAASVALQTQRKRAVQSKLDRGYEDYLDGKISEEFWTRKSAEWEAELTTVNGELSRLAAPSAAYAVTGVKILELARKAYFLYCQQNFEERRKLLEMVLSNCTFDRGTLCATYTSPFNLFAQGHETGPS
jgi:hypothetical protein